MRDPTAAHVADVIEALHHAFVVAMARAPEAEERDDAQVQWVIGGSPTAFFNCVLRADLDAHAADGVIAASRARFQARGVPGTWHVGPAMRPANLSQRLLAHGFGHVGADRGMALDLSQAVPLPAAPGGLRIEPVRDAVGLAEWAAVLVAGFELPSAWGDWFFERGQALGYAEPGPWRHWLGRLDGQAVATATALFGQDATGIHNVATVPQARR